MVWLNFILKANFVPGQVVVVAGGSGGIGSSIVDRFLNDGSAVAVVDSNVERSVELESVTWKIFADQNLVCGFLKKPCFRSGDFLLQLLNLMMEACGQSYKALYDHNL